MRRVVVTGLGMLTPLGNGVDINWQRLISGKLVLEKLLILMFLIFHVKLLGKYL